MKTTNTVKQILSTILHMPCPEQYTYIILGRPGPTGKTWLTEELKRRNFKAFEITESLIDTVKYSGSDNYFDIDDMHDLVVVVLNKSLPICVGKYVK